MIFVHWTHLYRGRLLERLGQIEGAAQAYHLALRANPRFARAASALARLCAKHGRYAEAERWLLEGSRFDSRNAKIWFNLGYVRDRMGEYERAIEAFREAVRLDPDLHQAWYGMGLCHAALGRHGEAAKAFGEAAARQPSNEFVWYQLGMAHHMERETEKVKEVAEHLLRFRPMMARKLIRDCGRSDLAYLVRDLER
jgi:tetratricopeptide (TPR) repeat protein